MNTIKVWFSAALFALLGLQSAGSFAAHLGCPDPSQLPTSSGCSLPGIKSSGVPYFDQGVKIKYRAKKGKAGDFNLKGSYDKNSARSSLVLGLGNIVAIGDTKAKIKIKVRKGVASGSVRISGTIDALGINKKRKLVKARMAGQWAVSTDGQLLGFNTMDIECNPMLPINCTDAESFYLALDEAINTGKKKLNTTGVAITTVPVPAAVWLFGSGLMGLAGMAHRRHMMMS